MIVELASAGIFRHFSVPLRPVVGGFCPFSADSNLDAFALDQGQGCVKVRVQPQEAIKSFQAVTKQRKEARVDGPATGV